jgi:hypothetical protein
MHILYGLNGINRIVKQKRILDDKRDMESMHNFGDETSWKNLNLK